MTTKRARRKIMTHHDERDSRRTRILVPIVILILCTSGLFCIAYSAMIGNVTNTGNVIATEGIVSELLNEDDSILQEGDFARNANGGDGATKLYSSTHTLDGVRSYVIPKQDLELGAARLVLETEENSDIDSIRISYEVIWNSSSINPVSVYGMEIRLESTEAGISLKEGEISTPIPINSEGYQFFLKGHIPLEKPLDVDLKPMEYTIKIHIHI